MVERWLTNRFFQAGLLLILLCVAVLFSFSDVRWRQQIRNFTFDNYNILRPRAASDRVVIVDIDEASLAKIGQMPWPRTVMADLVTKLKDAGAAVIVFDIVFAEADRSSPKEALKAFQGRPGFEELSVPLADLPDHDSLFGEAIKAAGNVVTGFSFTNDSIGTTPMQKGMFRGKGLEKFVPNLKGVSANLKAISRFSAGNGSFFVSTDTDGIIRRVPMLVAHKRETSNIVSVYPSLSLEILRVLDGQRGGRVRLGNSKYAQLDPGRFGLEGIELGKKGRFIPTNARGEFIVYFAKSNRDWYVPAHQILGGAYKSADFKGKIVFVGTSAVGLKDIRSTPLDTFIPGVEVHLNIVDQILQGQYLSRPIEAEGLEALSLFLVGLFIIIFAFFIGAMAQTIIVMLAIGAAVYAGWYGFETYGLLLDITYLILSVLSLFMFSTILTYLRAEKERRQVRGAFGLYISKDFMQELTKDPDKLKLGGEIRELSVIFTDIRRFTTISEGLAPEDLIQLMNDFLTPMSDLVMQNRGTIDKYMGDAMMAFWNAPLDDPDHARHACTAALGMQAALAPLNLAIEEKAQEAGRKPILLNAGIGINTGPCAVGNMGSKQRFAYSALGDAVNLASRFEGQTKLYGTGILMGEETYKQIEGFAALEADLIKVKGKTVPVRIYMLLGDEKMAAQAAFQSLKDEHKKMLHAYRKGDFKTARKHAQACREAEFGDLEIFYDLYLERCAALIKNPPGVVWDGVYEAVSK